MIASCIGLVCALVLLGSGLWQRRIRRARLAGLVTLWIVIIVAAWGAVEIGRTLTHTHFT